ncbi:MAG: hypothetical protein A2Z14_08355 [Chloroflexi bacterium RBG_16_48_8]|nr:MAG: hypothetical protein A2Z14_08355 [Chloroflexi bacterium RBG_16_48_8]
MGSLPWRGFISKFFNQVIDELRKGTRANGSSVDLAVLVLEILTCSGVYSIRYCLVPSVLK